MKEKLRVKIHRSSVARELELPSYETCLSAGVDLRASEEKTIAPGEHSLVGTGLFIELPEGYEAQIRPRSGLALKMGVSVLNSPGTIDADYRGEIKIILINLGTDVFHISPGDRIAQMVIAPVVQVEWEETDLLQGTERGSGGFGSTGI